MKPVLLIGALAALSGCASLENGGGDASPAGRGRSFVARECTVCHAIAAGATSPRAQAPTFAQIRLRYNDLSLDRELQAISSVGHYDMPKVAIGDADRADIIAFVESLSR